MSTVPENDPLNPQDYTARSELHSSDQEPLEAWPPEPLPPLLPLEGFEIPYPAVEDAETQSEPHDTEPPLFQSWSQPEALPPTRIPNLGHLCLLVLLLFFGFLATTLLTRSALHFHLFGVTTVDQAITDIHYTLGSQATLYLLTFLACLVVFPLVWHKSFLAGIQWNAATALRLRGGLFWAAFVCFVLAILNGLLIPGPSDTPIDKIFRTPGAAWLLFGFGVTFAPFFEEIAFRGFLLPALCTACDWTDETIFNRPNLALGSASRSLWSLVAMTTVCSVSIGAPIALIYAIVIHSLKLFFACLPIAPAVYLGLFATRRPQADQFIRPLGENGHPQWSFRAMAIGSIATSIPFALMHADQTGWSLGPFLLLICVSLVLCWVRLGARSLAASVLVHSCYNFLLFSLMLLGSGGFKHLDKM